MKQCSPGQLVKMMLVIFYSVALLSSTCLGTTSEFYDYGETTYDNKLNDSDASHGEIVLEVPFVLFGKENLNLYVSCYYS